MLDALHDLRRLGNDAAHVELKYFDEVDKEKVEVALDIGLAMTRHDRSRSLGTNPPSMVSALVHLPTTVDR